MRNESDNGPIQDFSNQVAALLKAATPEQHEFFYQKLQISNGARHDFVAECLHDIRQKILGPSSPKNVIPPKIHRLWLTNPHRPIMPRQYYIDGIKRQALSLGSEFQYIFWSNSNLIAAQLSETLSGTGFQFRDIATLAPGSQILARIDQAVAARKFVLAGDISKYLILRECGGIYADLGIHFEKPLIDLMKYSDLALFLDQNLFFQPALMAAAPMSEVFSDWCKLLSKPEILGSFSLDDCPKFEPGYEIWLHGGVGFTAFLMLNSDCQRSILTVPANRGLLRHESEGSWYRPGDKFGNVTLDDATVTHLNWQTHCDLIRLNTEMGRDAKGRDASDVMRMIRIHMAAIVE